MAGRLRIIPRWLFATAAALGLVTSRPAPAADAPVADADVVAWVAKRVEERQPAPAEKRFDEIGWARDLRTAIRLGKQHHRPVFLFTMDGRINTGRC